jgi:uncharacterized protein YhaN
VVGVGLLFAKRASALSYKGQIEDLDKEYNQTKERFTSLQLKLEESQEKVRKEYENYGVTDFISLKCLKDEWLNQAMESMSAATQLQARDSKISLLEEKYEKIMDSMIGLTRQLRLYEEDIAPMIALYHIESLGDFKELKDFKHQWLSLDRDIKSMNLRLEDALAGASINQLRESIDHLQSKGMPYKNIETYTAGHIEESTSELTEIIHSCEQEISEINARSQAYMRGKRSLSLIEEELEDEKRQLGEMETNRQVYELVRETIESITQEVSHNFAPLLNASLSEKIRIMTSEKYKDIKINPQLLMRLRDPDTHQMIKATSLSRGTLDLFYIGLRHAISDWLNGDKELPTVYDESFAHFDDQRLKNVLQLIALEKNQSLLFTCQRRELELAKELVAKGQKVTSLKL